MTSRSFSLNLCVQPDETQWVDYRMDEILDREAELARLDAYGDWCESLYEGAEHYPLDLTKDGLEGAEALPESLKVTASVKKFDPMDQNAKENVLVNELYLDGKALTQRPQLTSAGIVWVMPRRQEVIKQLVPPAENVIQGNTCETCKRFTHDAGQRWVNEVTHAFSGDGQSKQMRHDIIDLIGRSTDVQLPLTPKEWGACLEHDRLVERTFPGCDKYIKRVVWK